VQTKTERFSKKKAIREAGTWLAFFQAKEEEAVQKRMPYAADAAKAEGQGVSHLMGALGITFDDVSERYEEMLPVYREMRLVPDNDDYIMRLLSYQNRIEGDK
jgi:hypothetical protein